MRAGDRMFRAFPPVQMGLVKGSTPTLCSALPLPAGDVPDWLHLLPAGAVRTIDGRGPYHVGDAKALMAASIAAGKLPIDENHATDRAAPLGQSSPARGWIVEMAERDDGIWGRVEWTGPGRRMMEDKEYRGLSPAILHDKSGAISAILRASLTNTPNLAGLTALHSQEKTMDFRAWLIEALGLDADAADDAIVAAMKKAMEAKPADAVALQSALKPIAVAAGLAETADAAAVLIGVQQLKAGAGDNAVVIGLQSEIKTLATRLNEQTEATATREAAAFVDGAIAAGRVGVKPMRDEYISMHMKNPAQVTKLIGAMPIVKAGATITGDPAPGADGLGSEHLQVIQLMGIDREAYVATLGAEKMEVL